MYKYNCTKTIIIYAKNLKNYIKHKQKQKASQENF